MSNNGMLNAATHTVPSRLRPSSDTLTIADVIVKTAVCLGVVILAAVPGWIFLAGSIWLYLGILVVLMIFGIVLAKKAPIKAPLALIYSALLGLVVGAFSNAAVSYGASQSGAYQNLSLIPQAVLGTMAGCVAMLLVYATPFGKKASKAVKLFMGLIIGYFLIGVVSAVAAIFFGVGNGWGFYGVGTIGIVLCAVGVALACWSLLIDFGQTDRAIQNGAPRNYDWTFGVSLASSIVWLYMEILRLLSIVSR